MNLPLCPVCGNKLELAPGGSFSPGFTQRSYQCSRCTLVGTELWHPGGALLSLFRKDACISGEDSIFEYPRGWGEWVNGVLIPTWRHREAQLKAHEDLEWRIWLADIFYPLFPTLKGFVPPNYAQHGAASPFTETTISYHDCPPEAQALMDEQFGNSAEVPRKGTYLPYPPDLCVPVYPPQAPSISGMVLFYADPATKSWKQVDIRYSQTLPIPEDPILRSNREFFEGVWKEVAVPLPAPTLVSNEYGGVEPWLQFSMRGHQFTLGWRKRVVNIRVEGENLPTSAIRALAQKDQVTFSETPTCVTVPAWNKNKTVEYLNALLGDPT